MLVENGTGGAGVGDFLDKAFGAASSYFANRDAQRDFERQIAREDARVSRLDMREDAARSFTATTMETRYRYLVLGAVALAVMVFMLRKKG